MKKNPARLLAVLVFAAAGGAAAASDRFVPTESSFVVARVTNTMPDASLQPLVDDWQAESSDGSAIALASALLERAHRLREPMYVGRAEAVLAPLAQLPDSPGAIRRLYAQTLQYRHDFTGAERLLDSVLRADARDAAARTQRASVRLVRGDFAGARGDCAQLIAAGGAEGRIGLACLAEALAGIGEIDRARALLMNVPAGATLADSYLLAVRGEILERGGDADAAIVDYRAALALSPADDSIRAALADALAARGRGEESFALLDVERPSLALRVRRALTAPAARRSQLMAEAAEWLALELARGDALHEREGALLALGRGDSARALAAARANFATQREVADVRVLARAAVAAGDPETQREVRGWLATSGFRDVITERVLGAATGG